MPYSFERNYEEILFYSEYSMDLMWKMGNTHPQVQAYEEKSYNIQTMYIIQIMYKL